MALFIYGLLDSVPWEVGLGIFVMLVSAFGPRLKGQIEIAMGALKFKGELTVEPDGDEDEQTDGDAPGASS